MALTDIERFKNNSVLGSQGFHFLAGQKRRRLTIQAGLVENISPPLHTLINNGIMKESVSREAVLNDVEEDTFVALCERLSQVLFDPFSQQRCK
ncbi:hypothetical protein N7478_011173 [Penicillium angulare]|uniref:uncharacterized protein n=1 Tax=Penicillium angulare TaxID=116970 RepID=UPI002541E72A|nr:uncharacterized protein N7478_011173 [Penicillium angulare]KAJ5263568.1 hypothetical protein N7478_011173 [Penicillium angulare]